MEMRGPGPTRSYVLGSADRNTGFPDPVSMTVCPYLTSDLLASLRRHPGDRATLSAYAAAAAGSWYTPPRLSSAQMMRAFLLASATATSMRGLRCSMRASQEP